MKIKLLLVLLISCSLSCMKEREMREYVDIHESAPQKKKMVHTDSPHPWMDSKAQAPSMMSSDAQTDKMLNDSIHKSELAWDLPEGWNEKLESGMRIVTFTSKDADGMECSIVSLSGMAGGTGANIQRWMRQIGISVSPDELNQFVANMAVVDTQGGYKAKVAELFQLQKEADDSQASMMAAIIEEAENTIFIKMTGPKMAVIKHKDRFQVLLKSLRAGN